MLITECVIGEEVLQMETYPNDDSNEREESYSDEYKKKSSIASESIKSFMEEDADSVEAVNETTNDINQFSRVETTNGPETRKGLSNKTLLSIGGAALAFAITAGTFFGIGVSKRSNESSKPAQGYTDPSTPSATTEKPVVTTAQTTEKLDLEKKFESFQILEQKTSVEDMEAMTIEEFARLPYADRASYYFIKNPEAVLFGLNEELTLKQILGFYWNDMYYWSANGETSIDRAKYIAVHNYYTSDEKTGNLRPSYSAVTNSFINGYKSPAPRFAYVDSGEPQIGVDENGNKIKFTNVTYNLKEPSGEPIETATTQVIELVIHLQDGRTGICYPRGYGIEGKKSPASNYPY